MCKALDLTTSEWNGL